MPSKGNCDDVYGFVKTVWASLYVLCVENMGKKSLLEGAYNDSFYLVIKTTCCIIVITSYLFQFFLFRRWGFFVENRTWPHLLDGII